MKTMTVSAKPDTVKHDWYVVDASRQDPRPPVLGTRAPPARQAQARVHPARGYR